MHWMRVLVLLGLTGCHAVFGLDPTKVAEVPDAAFFDVREDFTCPPIGDTPKFSPVLTPIGPACTQYSESKMIGRAVAYCGDPVSGPLDGPFAAIAGLEQGRYVLPRLAPEGDLLYLRDNVTGPILIYRRTGDDAFSQSATVSFPGTGGEIVMGVPARGGRVAWARVMTAPPPTFEESVIASDGTVTPVGMHTVAELGVTAILGAPNFTPDGLRITFPARIGDASTGSNHMMYADRPGLGDPFDPARIIENIPYVLLQSPFLTETCARIYTSSGNQLVWAQRVE